MCTGASKGWFSCGRHKWMRPGCDLPGGLEGFVLFDSVLEHYEKIHFFGTNNTLWVARRQGGTAFWYLLFSRSAPVLYNLRLHYWKLVLVYSQIVPSYIKFCSWLLCLMLQWLLWHWHFIPPRQFEEYSVCFSWTNSYHSVDTWSFITLSKRKVEPNFWCHFKAKDVVLQIMYNTHIAKFSTWDSFWSDRSHILFIISSALKI